MKTLSFAFAHVDSPAGSPRLSSLTSLPQSSRDPSVPLCPPLSSPTVPLAFSQALGVFLYSVPSPAEFLYLFVFSSYLQRYYGTQDQASCLCIEAKKQNFPYHWKCTNTSQQFTFRTGPVGLLFFSREFTLSHSTRTFKSSTLLKH